MRPLESTYLEENGNPNLRHPALGESVSGQLLSILEHLRTLEEYLEKNGRENFGVQHLPLFNLLKPEELDWSVHHL